MAKIKSLDGLAKQISEIEGEIAALQKGWAAELKVISETPGFNVKSRKGKKKLEELGAKYADLIVGAQDKYTYLVDEYNKIVADKNEKYAHNDEE